MPFRSGAARKAFFSQQAGKGKPKQPGLSDSIIQNDQSKTMQNKIAGTPLVPTSNPAKQLKFPKLRKKLFGM